MPRYLCGRRMPGPDHVLCEGDYGHTGQCFAQTAVVQMCADGAVIPPERVRAQACLRVLHAARSWYGVQFEQATPRRRRLVETELEQAVRALYTIGLSKEL